jgi:hypothetical protein
VAALALPEVEDDIKPVGLKPMDTSGLNLGLYAPFEMSPEDMYGPDELGTDNVSAIKAMVEGSCKYEDAAVIWEKVQAAEARLFDRGYQWLTNDKTGAWTIAGTAGGSGVGAGAITQQDKGKMWSINMYGARKDKIVAAVTVKDPVPEFFAKNPQATATDGRYAEEADKYKHLWKMATNVRNLCVKVGGLFYTDDRVALITESIADSQRFGDEDGKPAIRELTRAYGKLEFSVPMSIDEDDPLPWCRRERELDKAVSQEKYSWVKNISANSGGGQIARTCRLTVRNAVQNQTGFTSNATDRAVTETTWWVRPSQFRDIPDEGIRKMMRDLFKNGARIVFIGGEFAYIRNEKMDDCVIILYSRDGTGQNRRSIGSNNLVVQKILNYDFNLFNRYMTACVPRKMHDVNKIKSEAIQQQRNDPAYSMPVDRDANEDITNYTGIEQVPTPPAQLMDFIDSLTEALPTTLDGASPSMFGGTDGTDTVGGITIQRDQALQVFGTPYNALTWGIAISCGNAAKWAGKNRQGNASGMVPGVGRISVDFAALATGDADCFPEADSGFPESEAEKELRLEKFIDSGGVPTVLAAAGDPMNFESANRATKRFGITIPGTDSVRKQQEEFEVLLKSAPQPNPVLIQAQVAMQQSQEHAVTDPQAMLESQSPEGQQAMQQAQQAIAQIPPLVTSVPVEQNASVNHVIEAAVCFNKINSPEGQKLKREQPPIFQNLMLHWQGHTDMAAKLAPPPASPEVKPGVTLAVDKLGPIAQTAVLQKEYGITVAPEEVQPTPDVHEITQEKEGVDEGGVPVKQKISYSGAALQ